MNNEEYRSLFDEIGWEEQRNRRIISIVESHIRMVNALDNYPLAKVVVDAFNRSTMKTIRRIWQEWEAGNVSNGE